MKSLRSHLIKKRRRKGFNPPAPHILFSILSDSIFIF